MAAAQAQNSPGAAAETTAARDARVAWWRAYTIELHFNEVADESDRCFFNSVPTRLQLPASTVERLKKLAAV